MRLEIHCPKCNHKYLLDEGAVPAKGARLTCRSCGYRWEARQMRGPVAEPEYDPLAEAPESQPSSPRSPAPSPVAGSSPPGQTFITCPGCGLRFVVLNAPADGAGAPHASAPASVLPGALRNPWASAGGQAAAGPPATGRGGPGKTILVVEDVEYFTSLARNALGKKYRTVTVASVADALKVIDNEPIDLLVLDLTLQQGEDGRQVLRSLEKKDFPVLIFTARDENEMYGETWKELQSLGADDMLIKGMNVEEDLLLKVGTLLSKK